MQIYSRRIFIMSIKLLLYIFVQSLFFDIADGQSCYGKTFCTLGKKEIRLFHERVTFEEAKRRCDYWGRTWLSSQGGELVSIVDENDQQCIDEMISTASSKFTSSFYRDQEGAGYFVGATNHHNQWKNGDKVTRNYRINKQQGETCMQVMLKNFTSPRIQYKLGQLLSAQCNDEKYYICEREVHPDLRWGYGNNQHAAAPEEWTKFYRKCSGNHQSPINIPSHISQNCETKMERRLIRGWKVDYNASWIVNNTGRFIKIEPSPPNSMYATYHGATDKHYVDYMVLKWGKKNQSGSDHMVDHRGSTGELQVFFKPASIQSEEINAFSFLIQEKDSHLNRRWSELLHAIGQAQHPGYHSTIKAPKRGVRMLLTHSLYPHDDHNRIRRIEEHAYRYKGSIPHPPCTQNVIWTVFTRPIDLSTQQFDDLRKTVMEGGEMQMSGNNRPIQENPSQVCHLTR